MATQERETNINVQLFKELTDKYPEVPKEVVSAHLRTTGNNREEVIKRLKSQSAQYLFGGSEIKPGTVTNQINKLTLSKWKETTPPSFMNQRSDSGFTGTSMQSLAWPTSSASTVRPIPQPSYTAPILPTDFDPFMQAANSKQSLQSSIPNINCTVDSNSPSVSQTVKKFEVNNSVGNRTSPVTGKRPVPVIHCSSSQPVDSGSSSMSTSYQIHSGTSGGTCIVNQPTLQSFSSYYISPVSSVQSSVTNTPSQYATQARFMINPPSNKPCDPPPPPRPNYLRTNHPGGDQGNVFVQPNMSTVSHTSPVDGIQNFNKPLFVNIRSTYPGGSETHVYDYSGNRDKQSLFGNTTLNRPVRQPQYPGGSRLQISSLTPNQSPGNSNMTSYVTLPHHGGKPLSSGSHTNSEDSEHGNVFMCTDDLNPVLHYPMSPSSSHSSLSSESSTSVIPGRPNAGPPVQATDDQDYLSALLHHQRLRLDNLKRDYQDTQKETEKLRQEVAQMEVNMIETSRRNSFPTVEDISKLREINRRLQTDIQCMGNEIDMKKNGPGMNSLVDPMEQQNFFANMPTGPSGPIGRPVISSPSSSTPPPLPPLPKHTPMNRQPRSPLDVVPPVPPRQPASGSGDSEEGEQWNCSACTFLNHPALNKCECCEMPRLGTTTPHHHNGQELCYCHNH